MKIELELYQTVFTFNGKYYTRTDAKHWRENWQNNCYARPHYRNLDSDECKLFERAYNEYLKRPNSIRNTKPPKTEQENNRELEERKRDYLRWTDEKTPIR